MWTTADSQTEPQIQLPIQNTETEIQQTRLNCIAESVMGVSLSAGHWEDIHIHTSVQNFYASRMQWIDQKWE